MRVSVAARRRVSSIQAPIGTPARRAAFLAASRVSGVTPRTVHVPLVGFFVLPRVGLFSLLMSEIVTQSRTKCHTRKITAVFPSFYRNQ